MRVLRGFASTVSTREKTNRQLRSTAFNERSERERLTSRNSSTSSARGLHKPYKTEDAHGQASVHGWTPIWLRRWFIAAFTATCTALVAGILILFLISRRDHGIPLITSNHYTYTYAPIAVLILIVAIWRQIDYHIKLLKPWDVLAHGDSEASRSVLLDYISPLQITSFYEAIRNKHTHVVLSTSVFFLLKLVTLVSTGLLLPVSTDLESDRSSFTKLATFNGSQTNSSLSLNLTGASILYNAYGILAKDLVSQDGIQDSVVFEPFILASDRAEANVTSTAEVDALIPKFLCESAPVEIIPQPTNITDENPEDVIRMTFPECTMPNNLTGRSAYVLNPQTFLCPSRQLSPVMQPITCIDGGDSSQLLTISDFRYNQTFDSNVDGQLGDRVQASSWSTSLNRTTSIACRSTYSMHRVNITYDMSSDVPRIVLGTPSPDDGRKLDGLTDSYLGRLFTASLADAADMFGNVLEGAYADEYPQTMSKFMAAIGDDTYESLFNETTMITRAEKVFQAVAAQIVHKNFMQNVSEPLTGTVRSSEIRLHVNELSLWTMVAGFSITIIIGIWLSIFQLHHGVPRDPEPLINTGLVMSESRRARAVFQANDDPDFFQSLEHYHFSTEVSEYSTEKFGLLVRGGREVSPDLRIEKGLLWWTPLFIRRYMYLISLLLPLACIVALEVIQRVSDSQSRNGFATVQSTDGLSVKFCTRYLPALILLLVATMINSVDFNIAVIAPYQALTRKWTSAKGPMSEAILGKTPPEALVTLVKHQNFGPLLSALAALLASVLTIVVSGLYVIEGVDSPGFVTLRPLDSFDVTWKNSAVVDNGAAVLTSLSESANLSYAPFTYEDLAFPRLALVENSTALEVSANSTLYMSLPAWRGSLNCSKDVSFNTSRRSSAIGKSAFIQASVNLPPQCQFGGASGNGSTIEFSETFQFGLNNNASLIGKFINLHVGPFNDTTMSSSGEVDPKSQPDNPLGCPSVALIYGHVDVNSEADTHISTLVCYQEIHSTPTDLLLTYPDLLIHPSSPPRSDLGANTPMTINGHTSFSFRPQLHFDRKLALFNQHEFDSSNSANSPVDPFFQAVLFGKHPISQTDFLEDPTQTEQRINMAYARYMAQAISANMRVPLQVSSSSGTSSPKRATEEEEDTLTAILRDPTGTLRVRQNRTSKLALQILLATIVAFMTIALKVTRLKEVLLYNPCCIAGTAALWAGSRFCEGEAGKDTVGWEFRLGWCEGEGVVGGGEGRLRRWGIDARCVGKGEDGWRGG